MRWDDDDQLGAGIRLSSTQMLLLRRQKCRCNGLLTGIAAKLLGAERCRWRRQVVECQMTMMTDECLLPCACTFLV
jgi:hypothetical protein